jgi:large conductance mechanosensitive channel
MIKEFYKEFKTFAMKGNVIDMAVGIIIGAAFGKIVTSMVNDILMPPLGVLMGGVDFGDKVIVIKQANALTGTKEVALRYGLFINQCIDFVIVAFAIFIVIKMLNKLKKEEAAAPPKPTATENLLTEIRDLLKK